MEEGWHVASNKEVSVQRRKQKAVQKSKIWGCGTFLEALRKDGVFLPPRKLFGLAKGERREELFE